MARAVLFTGAMTNQRKHHDDAFAFLPDPRDGAPVRVRDDLALSLAAGFVLSATSAEEAGEANRDQVLPEEIGGPFLEVAAGRELDLEPDASNPVDAEMEPFPTALRSPS
jgi:hypothetical protein